MEKREASVSDGRPPGRRETIKGGFHSRVQDIRCRYYPQRGAQRSSSYIAMYSCTHLAFALSFGPFASKGHPIPSRTSQSRPPRSAPIPQRLALITRWYAMDTRNKRNQSRQLFSLSSAFLSPLRPHTSQTPCLPQRQIRQARRLRPDTCCLLLGARETQTPRLQLAVVFRGSSGVVAHAAHAAEGHRRPQWWARGDDGEVGAVGVVKVMAV